MVRVFLTALTLGILSFTIATPETAPATAAKPAAAATVVDAAEVAALKEAAFDNHVQQLYTAAGLKAKGLSYDVFEKAVIGFQNFQRLHLASSDKSILSIVDFTKSSSKKRLWVIDLNAKKVLFNSLVAHGRNTGQDKAMQFSNSSGSYMSSLGFYLTDATYYGKHGLSLRLNGMDEGFNTNAMERAIVVHGADYVSDAFVKQYGRLGRSLGCPSVPKEISKDVIEAIKDKTVLYIHGNDRKYTSRYLNNTKAIEFYAAQAGADAVSI
ncbi:murein L,D-transpeptidase catalytic domain family protein [Pontibacter mangrovi]|uniref:Murein L,D-transpeptidase catalytic domain family protein n=1 Tax=Pontibacter mangrovi TaxID=2589816 RepID=A0A501VXS3_9BACT|nr:murein L,D-transpeptidase catalytic domain family protein [Pontibacter mangrovi]TPE42533.1 murein L,D-transpeptidase catalytic domain family protein [Pontibacter mangrovi]